MLGKRRIEWFFLFKLKMGPKATETTLQINKAFAQEHGHVAQWAAQLQKRWGSGGQQAQDDERPLGVDDDQPRAIIKDDAQDAAKELHTFRSVLTQHLKLIGKVKRLSKWMISWVYQSQQLF